MPIVTVYGLRSGEPDDIRRFRDELKDVVSSVQVLGIIRENVSVYIVQEYAPPDQSDVVVKIEGLFPKPDRTPRVQEGLAALVLGTICGYLREHHKDEEPTVEVFVYTFNPAAQGFATNHKKPPALPH